MRRHKGARGGRSSCFRGSGVALPLRDACVAAIDRHEAGGDGGEHAQGQSLAGVEVLVGLGDELFAREACGFELIGSIIGPVGEFPAEDFGVVLEGVEVGAEGECLDLAAGAGGEQRAAGGKFLDFGRVPVRLDGGPADAGVDGVDFAGFGEGDGMPAELALLHRPDFAAECAGEELTAEAESDEGDFGRACLLEEGEFGGHPGKGLVGGVVGSAGGDDAIEVIEIGRERLAEVGSADVEPMAEIAEDFGEPAGG